ncbi:MAG: Fe-S cluster assembly protein SufD [Oligoflexia bacterium]|nr:Fe-S cluster assembly protein SufD [Oligoflexia bacterium]
MTMPTLSFSDSFDVIKTRKESSWLQQVRLHAYDRYLTLGLPTTKDEQWRYTSLLEMSKNSFNIQTKADLKKTDVKISDIKRFLFSELTCHRLVFVDGVFTPSLSQINTLPPGVTLSNLQEGIEKHGPILKDYITSLNQSSEGALQALNLALMTEGVVLHLDKEVTLGSPLHLVYVSTDSDQPKMSHPRNIIIAEQENQAIIIESYVSLGSPVSLTNTVTDLIIGPNSVLDHYRIQEESSNGYHVARLNSLQASNSQVNSHNYSWGGKLSRNEILIKLNAEGSECHLHGLYTGKNSQHTDNHTVIEHLKPHTKSVESYKGILNDKSRGIFSGKIFVKADAQKIDAQQSNKNLLLSDDATANTRPQLEIYADDVKCSHGATIGQLDSEALFFLRARGIGLKEAKHILTLGFASDVFDKVRIPAVKTYLEGLLREVL